MKRLLNKTGVKKVLVPAKKPMAGIFTMGDSCHICGDMSYDNCTACGRATCKNHGKRAGDYFACRRCADTA